MLDTTNNVTDVQLLETLKNLHFIVALGDNGLARLYILSRLTDRVLEVQDVFAGERPDFLD